MISWLISPRRSSIDPQYAYREAAFGRLLFLYSKRRTAFFWGWFVSGKNNMKEEAESAAAVFGYIGDRDDERRLTRKEDFLDMGTNVLVLCGRL